MTDQGCAVCGSMSIVLIQPRKGLSYRRCRTCSHHALVTTHEDASQSFDLAQKKYYGDQTQLLVTDLDLFEAEALTHRKAMLGSHLSRPCDVLEVGPGTGHVLQWLKAQGHNVTAVEHSPALARQLSDRLKLPVLNGEFETLDLAPASFDAFCSFHVIEHVSDPLAHLRKAHALVRPGGIAFVATPNARSWQQLLFPPLSPNFDSAHLFVFSPASLQSLCAQSGWEIVATLTPDRTGGWVRVLTKGMRRLKGEDEEATAGKYSRPSSAHFQAAARLVQAGTFPLRYLQSRLGYGNEILLVLRKPLAGRLEGGTVANGEDTARPA